jgi:hypothetical protein
MIVFGKNEYLYGSLNAWRCLYQYVNGWNCLILESVGINIVVGTATILLLVYMVNNLVKHNKFCFELYTDWQIAYCA